MELISKLQEQLVEEKEMLKTGATSYRYRTATLALDFLPYVTSADMLKSRELLQIQLEKTWPTLDEDRIADIAKFLHVSYTQLANQMNRSSEMKQLLDQRRANREKFTLKLVKG